MGRILFIARKILGGYGLLYNWWATQLHAVVEYGYLYNWYAATDSRNIAPVGFHVPSIAEQTTLTNYLGGQTVAGGKLKETGLTYWNSTNATNEVGFNFRGSGLRTHSGTFTGFKVLAYLSSITVFSATEYDSRMADTGLTFYDNVPNKKVGTSLRFIADSGTPTTVTGNDGKVYSCVTIGTQTWTAENSMETLYRDGSAIPEVTDNTAWSNLTTGARCSYNNTESNAGTIKSIAPDGWHVPTDAEFDAFIAYLTTNQGGKLKETGLTYWNTPNTGATNEVGFNGRGSGQRGGNGIFGSIKLNGQYRTSDSYTFTNAGGYQLSYNLTSFDNFKSPYQKPKTQGMSLRLIKDDPTGWVAGDTVTDAEGNVYQTVMIGTQVWIASNWKCTKWSDGTPIDYVEANAAWAALTTAAWCYPNGDINNK